MWTKSLLSNALFVSCDFFKNADRQRERGTKKRKHGSRKIKRRQRGQAGTQMKKLSTTDNWKISETQGLLKDTDEHVSDKCLRGHRSKLEEKTIEDFTKSKVRSLCGNIAAGVCLYSVLDSVRVSKKT